MADGTHHSPVDIFTALAQPRAIKDLGPITDRTAFSRHIMPDGHGITVRSMAIKVANSPIIIPPLFLQFTAAVSEMARDHATDPRFSYKDSRASVYVSQEYLQPGRTNLFGDLHTDIYNIEAALNGREPAANIYLISNIFDLTARIYPQPVIFDQKEQSCLRNPMICGVNRVFHSALSEKLQNTDFIHTHPDHIYRFGIYDPHDVPNATNPVWRTVLSVHFETDSPIESVKARAKARPFKFENNPELADWVRQHAKRPQDYGL